LFTNLLNKSLFLAFGIYGSETWHWVISQVDARRLECLLTYGCSFRWGVGPDDFDDSLIKAEASEKIEELKTF